MRLPVNRLWPLAALLMMSACAGGASVKDVPPPAANGPASDYPMVLGSPFVIEGVTYTPADTLNYDAVGIATVSGEGGSSISAAHRTLPLPSYAEVTSLDSGRTILVRVERRGPMSGNAVVDLSPGAAAQLGLTDTGRVDVRIRRVNPPEVERAALRSGQAAPARMDTPQSLLKVLHRKLDMQLGIASPQPTLPLPEAATLPAPQQAMPAANTAQTPKAALVKPAPGQPMGVPNKPSKEPQVKTASTKGVKSAWYVQIGVFANKANAEAAAAKASAGMNAAGKLWRVRAGPFDSPDKAKQALAKVRSSGYRDARVLRAD